MARILLATFGSYGDVNPYLVLGRALRARGHGVVLLTLEAFRAEAAGAGLEFAPMRPDVAEGDDAAFRRIVDRYRGAENLVRDLLVPAIGDMHADTVRAAEGCDLLVSHVLTFAVPVVAEERRLPWMASVLSPMVFFSAHDPPVPAPAPFLGRIRVPFLQRGLLALYRGAMAGWWGPVKALRRSRGLPPGGNPMFDGLRAPSGVLGLFSPEFGEPQPDWPAGTRVTGFLFRDEDFGGRGIDPALASFLAAGPPPVVFTLGSAAVRVAGGFYREAAAAAASLGVRAVLLAGEAPPSPLPAGVAAFPSAPYHALFPAAAAVVHSGGVGTTAQALRAGRPQVVVPFAHDQFDNAERVRRRGLGTVAGKDWPARRLAAVLRELLADAGTRERAAATGRRVSAEDGPGAAVAAVEAALAARPQAVRA